MNDWTLFERIPQWLGAHFLDVLLAVAVIITVLILVGLHMAPLHARACATRSQDGNGWWWSGLQAHPRLVAFIGNPYSPEHRLARWLLLGLLAGGASLYGFISLLDEVLEVEELESFDRALALAVHQHALPAARQAFAGVTWLGSYITVTSVGVLVGVPMLVRRHWIPLMAWAGALAGGGLINAALKAAIARRRPELETAMYAEGWSFPSGHSMSAVTCYGMLAYLATQRFPERVMLVVPVAVLLVLMTGASRMYLGVHYFSDVLGGFLAGAVWLAICIAGCEYASAGRSPFEQARDRACA